MASSAAVERNLKWLTLCWGDLKEVLLNWDQEEQNYLESLDFDWSKAASVSLRVLSEAELTDEQRACVRDVLRDVEPFISQIESHHFQVPSPELMKAFLEPPGP